MAQALPALRVVTIQQAHVLGLMQPTASSGFMASPCALVVALPTSVQWMIICRCVNSSTISRAGDTLS